MVDPIAALGSM
jgi:hypothetical protein